MMGGSSTRTATTTQNSASEPWAPAQPALQGIIGSAGQIYSQGYGSGVYGGDRTAGLGATTQAGLNSMAENAGAGQGAAQAGDRYLTTTLANGGATTGTTAAVNQINAVPNISTTGVSSIASRMSDPGNTAYTVANGLASGAYNLDTAGYERLGQGISGQTQTERSLQRAADGAYLGGANPQLDAVIGRSQAEAASRVGQSMSAAGRYGSGRYAASVADAVGGIGTNLRYQDYSAERDRQASAANAIDSQRNARTGVQQSLLDGANNARATNANIALSGGNLYNSTNSNALSGATSLAGIEAQNAGLGLQRGSLALSAAQGDRTAAYQGLGMVGANATNLQQPGRTLAGVGAIEDAARQDRLNSDMQTFQDQQSAPWQGLGLYSSIVNPIASAGGTSTGTSVQRTPQPSMLQQLFGMGLAGANVASRFI